VRLLRELNCEFDEYARDDRATVSEVVRRAVSECIHRCKSDPRQHLVVYVHRLFQGSTPEHDESCKSLTENMDITSPAVQVWDVFRVTAWFEGDLVRDRTDPRLQVNSLKGRKDGHPLKLNMRQLARIREIYESRVLVECRKSCTQVQRGASFACMGLHTCIRSRQKMNIV
jgi:hypothetical protein